MKTGKTLWTSEPRQGAKAALQRAGNLVFILESDGELLVARESRTAFDVVKRYKVAERRNVVAAGHLGQPHLRQGRLVAHALDPELVPWRRGTGVEPLDAWTRGIRTEPGAS